MSKNFYKIGALALILLAYTVAESSGGNGFIAAFIMGMVAGDVARNTDEDVHEHVEVEVSLLILLTFVLFGAVLLPQAIDGFNGMTVLYALISLTLIRMIPVGISLIGSGVRPITTTFIGWFGPRGTASILYIFTVFDTKELIGADLIYDVAMITVFFSIFLHGLTAAPLAKRYGSRMAALDERRSETMEMDHVPEMPLRAGSEGLTKS